MSLKEFPLSACLSVSTGRLCGNFGDMHELAEHLLGHPVWTHEFADRVLVDRLEAAMNAAVPGLPNHDAAKHVDKTNYLQFVAEWEGKLGKSVMIPKGSTMRTENPVESLERMMPGKPVVVVEAPTEAAE